MNFSLILPRAHTEILQREFYTTRRADLLHRSDKNAHMWFALCDCIAFFFRTFFSPFFSTYGVITTQRGNALACNCDSARKISRAADYRKRRLPADRSSLERVLRGYRRRVRHEINISDHERRTLQVDVRRVTRNTVERRRVRKREEKNGRSRRRSSLSFLLDRA